MKSSKRGAQILRMAWILLSLLAAGVLTAAVLFRFDSGTNYFQRETILPAIAVALSLLAILCGILSAILTDRTTLQSAPIFFQAEFPWQSLALFIAAVSLPILDLTGKSATAHRSLAIPAAVFLFLGAGYHALILTRALRQKYLNYAVLSGFCAMIGCILLHLCFYFDRSVEMNAPFKVCLQIGLLFSVLYYTVEIRYLLRRQKPRLFLILSAFTLSAGALSAIALPVGVICGAIEDPLYAFAAMPSLAAAVSAALRSLQFQGTGVTDQTNQHGKDLPDERSRT